MLIRLYLKRENLKGSIDWIEWRYAIGKPAAYFAD
jgi:hypothetical protein